MSERRSIQDWVVMADAKLAQLAPLMKPLWEHDFLLNDERLSLSWLATAGLRASGSVLLLVEAERVWDATIVSRSGFEATLRFCFLLSDRAKFRERHAEFETHLPEISHLADHDKAKRLLDTLPVDDPGVRATVEGVMLSDERLQAIAKRYPQSVRREMQRRWGPTGLIEEMARSGDQIDAMMASFLHSYAMSSHVAHSDHIGVGVVMEREYRHPANRLATHRAHAARLLSGEVWSASLRLFYAYRFMGLDSGPIWGIVKDDSDFGREVDQAQEEFHRVEYGIEPPGEGR